MASKMCIRDRYISRRDDGSFIFDGLAPLDEVGEALDVEFDEDVYKRQP